MVAAAGANNEKYPVDPEWRQVRIGVNVVDHGTVLSSLLITNW